MTTKRPWELHPGEHVRWGGTTITVLHEPELDHGSYHVPARRSDTGRQVDMELTLAHTVEMADASQPVMDGWNGAGWEHYVGREDCPGCWSDAWPVSCETEGCGGLVHAEFEDENYDGDYWLSYRCDRCGSTDRPGEAY